MISVGIGLTNDCNLSCAHCYRDRNRLHALSLADIKKLCESIEIGSVGFGTGENGLNPDYHAVIEYLAGKGIKMTLASNGYTLSITPDDRLRWFSDVEFSVDFPDRQRQDDFRGNGNWETVMKGIERCRRLGIRVSMLAVLMNINHRDIGRIAALAASVGADFRVNVYQPMHTPSFMPNFEEYWRAYEILFSASEIISVSEPLVNAFLGLGDLAGNPCGGRSIRVTPEGRLKPCVYWPTAELSLQDLERRGEDVFASEAFRQTRYLPRFCEPCVHRKSCGGGCAGRRALRGGIVEPDEYCPIVRGKQVVLHGTRSTAKKPLRTKSICTTIVRSPG